jgi:hypothetical protein
MPVATPWIRIGRVLLGLLVAAALLARAGATVAAVPSQANSTVDHVIIGSYNSQGAISGQSPCLATATMGFDVVVRDFANNPIPGSVVTIIFGGTGTSIRPYVTQDPGVTVLCGSHGLQVTTDASGHAHLVPRFGRFSNSAVIPVSADGILLAHVSARSPDYQNDGAVDLGDFTTFAQDYADQGGGQPRSDFDDCPQTRLGDFVFFAAQFLASSVGGAQPFCP